MRYQFNATSVEITDGPLPPVPLNWYRVAISREEAKPTEGAAGKGTQLAFFLKVLEGDYSGREQRHGMNLDNPNATTVRIAQEELSKYAYVVGRPVFNDTQELFGIPFFAQMGPQKDEPRYGEVYEVRDVNGKTPAELAKMGQQQSAPFVPATAAQQQQPAPAWGAPAAQPVQQWGQQQPANPSQPQAVSSPFASPAASIAPSPFGQASPQSSSPFATPANGAPGAATASPSNWQQPGTPQAVPAWARK